MSNPKLDAAFKRVCHAGLDEAYVDDIKTIAIALWHNKELPDLSILTTDDALKIGGFILDRLCRFNCVPYDLKHEVLSLVGSLSVDLSKSENSNPQKKPIDKLASKWGLSSDLCKFMGDILPFQTRHAFGCSAFA